MIMSVVAALFDERTSKVILAIQRALPSQTAYAGRAALRILKPAKTLKARR
jgi:hypothetical protein